MRHDEARRHQVEGLMSSLYQAQDHAARLKQQLDHQADSRLEVRTDESLLQQLNAAQERSAQFDAEHQRDNRLLRALEAQVSHLESQEASAVQDARHKDGELATLRGQMEAMRGEASQKESELVAQQYRISELSDQLNAQKVALDDEQQLLAEGRDIRDVMAARNDSEELHELTVTLGEPGAESKLGRFLTEHLATH